MTSMSSVATDGSVSGSRLVTQNMLLGLDRGWMMRRGTGEHDRHDMTDVFYMEQCGFSSDHVSQ